MCGICGVFMGGGESTALKETVKGMCSRMTHRGPDEEGVYASGPVALGHRRLSIIDISSGQQPLCNEDGTVWVVFNGEIYNYRAIREDLIRKGHRFRTNSDTEVLVHLYEDRGEAMFELLNGMFAIGIWDGKREKLLLGRDRLGKKPLYYCRGDGKISFASELKAILADPDVPRSVLPESVSNYLSFQYIPPPATIFAGICKLEPATYLAFQDGVIRKKKFWAPDFGRKSGLSREAAIGQFQELLLDAVRIRMESEVPLGAFLSGGIDSSTVVALMAGLSDHPVNTTSIGFRESSFNELPYAREVSRRYATTHNEYVLEPDFMRDIGRIVYHLDEPFGDSSALPTYLLCGMTRRNVTVAMSGDGGDENFAGYDRYMSALLEERVRRTVPPLLLRLLFSVVKRTLSPYVRSYTRIENMALELPLAACNTFFCFDDDLKRTMFTESFRRKLGGHRSDLVMKEIFRQADGLDPLNQLQYADLSGYLPEDILMKVDRMSMAHSLEVRAPLLDYRVVEFAGSLLPEWHVRNGSGKAFLRDAVKGWIPEKVFGRPKMGFGVPIGDWFRGKLQRLMEGVLFDDRTLGRGYFEPDFLRGLWARHLRGPAWQIDVSQLLWVLLVLELWHRLYVDRESLENLEGWIDRVVCESVS